MNAIRTRTIVFGCALALLLSLGAFACWENIRQAELTVKEGEIRYAAERTHYDETIGRVLALSGKAKTLAEWESVRMSAESLPEQAKKHFTLLAQVRTMELLADERDQLLANAGALFAANENDPGVKENVAKALVLHERAEALVRKIEGVPGNGAWNRSLQYRKAYEKYRSLAFLAKDENGKALDILGDAVSNLVKGLDAVPKDNRTELAVEFLYKRAKEEEAKAQRGGEDPGPPRAFPNDGAGSHGPGTGGGNRPRQH